MPPSRRCVPALVASLILGGACCGAEPLSEQGQAIYQRRCAACHGKSGEGVADHYEKPLVGSATVEELAETIAETMPEDEPEACVGREALAVATYVHGAFYSKGPPPRIRLARLTGVQLRQSLADLYAHFAGPAGLSEEHGLRGEYYSGSRARRGNRKLRRTDPTIDFDFGDQPPAEGIDPQDYYIQWTGGLKVDVTGTYELIVRSTCAFVFYLGGEERELINNHVQSGDKTEFRRSIALTAGRVLPLRIRFYQRKRKTAQPPGRITLSWVPPYGGEEVVPERNLLADSFPATFMLQAKLPPDDRSYGYERGIAVDRQWDDSTTAAAIEFADAAADDLWPRWRRNRRGGADEDRGPLRDFLAECVATAFRGPLDDRLRKLYVDAQVDAAEDDAEAIKRSLLMTLKSPRFLYPLLDEGRSPSQRVANRLALTLYDSLPADDWLTRQVAEDKLQTEEEIRAAARQMVDDYRTRGKTRAMLYGWLNLERIGEIHKDGQAFPNFDAAVVGDLRASLDAFLDDVVWSPESDFRQLLTADWTYTNERLESYYGDAWKPAAEGTGLQRSAADPNRRGLLTHPYLMSGLAHAHSTSPIHRGVFLLRHVLGRTLRPPQAAFTPLSAELRPDLTTRQRVTLQTNPQNCQVCHAKINALGFTLENFDAVGRYRVKENSRAIDTAGGYTARDGKQVEFAGPRELSAYLADSDDAHRAFVETAFEYFVKQPPASYGPETLERLLRSFRESEFNIRQLLVEIAVIAAQPAER